MVVLVLVYCDGIHDALDAPLFFFLLTALLAAVVLATAAAFGMIHSLFCCYFPDTFVTTRMTGAITQSNYSTVL